MRLASRGAQPRATGAASARGSCSDCPLPLSRPPASSNARRAAPPPAATRTGATPTNATTSSGRVKPGTAATGTTTTTATRGGRAGTTSASPAARMSDAERDAPERGERGPGRGYINFTGFPFPLGPYLERRTTRTEVVKGSVWTFEQTQAIDFFAVYTPVRMTVVKLASTGGLWVHAPVAPTPECLRLLRELGAPVEHVVLPTFAYEHKVFVGPFARRFPRAQVWVAPAQWSFPVNLPPQFFGIFPAGELFDFSQARGRARARAGGGGGGGLREEEDDAGAEDAEAAEGAGDRRRRGRGQQQQQQQARARRRAEGAPPPPPPLPALPPWADEIDCKLLRPPQLGRSRDIIFSEAALFHRASRTLMVTDAVVYVPRDPPAVIPRWALLALGARDGFLATYLTGGRTKEQVDAEARRGPQGPDTPEARRLGWARMSLLVLYFRPHDLLTPGRSFAAVSERLIVGPVVRELVYSKIPRAVARWVDDITSEWNFERVVPCHFAGPVKAGPAEFREAFDFCYEAAAEREAAAGRGGVAAAAGAEGGAGGLFGELFGRGALEGGPGAALAALIAAATGRGGRRRAPAPARQLPAEDLGALRALDELLVRVGAVFPDAEERAEAEAAAASTKGQ